RILDNRASEASRFGYHLIAGLFATLAAAQRLPRFFSVSYEPDDTIFFFDDKSGMAHAFAHLLFREHELEAPALGFNQRITILLLHLLLLLGQAHAHFAQKEMTLQWHVEHADDDKGDHRGHGKRLQGGNHHLPETAFAAGRCLEQRRDEATQDGPEGGGQDDDFGQTLDELDHVA